MKLPYRRVHIFDLDDTLINTKQAYYSSYIDVSAATLAVTKPVAARLIDHLLPIYGSSNYYKIFQEICLLLEIKNGNRLTEKFATSFQQSFWSRLKVNPGALDYLNNLRQKGCQLALASNGNSQIQRVKLAQLKLADFFSQGTCMISSDIGAHKPDPAMLNRILQNLKLSVTQALFYGNSLVDFLAAKHCGMSFVLYDYNHSSDDFKDLSLPYIINSWEKLL